MARKIYPLQKDELLSRYESGFSLAEIANTLDCSVHKVRYWMEKHKIQKRNISDALYCKYNKKERYHIRLPKTPNEYLLLDWD